MVKSKVGASTPKKAPKRKVSEASLQNLQPAWAPGQSGNPAGRKKGSRNVLDEQFISALQEDFQQHGVKAIETVREARPHEYLKVIAGVLPKDVNVRASAIEDLSDDELAASIAALRSIIAAQAVSGGDGPETKH